MFSFEITPLGNLFFGLTLIVFFSLVSIRFRGAKFSGFKNNSSFFLYSLLVLSLGIIFYAHDLVTLFIGWESMSWSSYFIISQSAKLKTMQKYIIFNLGAGFALLGAIVLIYSSTGTFIYNEILFTHISTELRVAISTLLFITIFIKSGVLPFHYWVVDTYNEADHIFSAILSAVVSKAGIFLFILMFTQIIGYKYVEPYILDVVAWLGVITSIVATFKAIYQESLKKLLAYSSIAQIGYIITVLSILNSSGIEAGIYHTVIHTFVKLLLFMNLASIIYITGKSKFSELGGLLYEYPILFILLLVGIIGLAGMPPLGGFNSKFLIYTTLLEEKKALLLTAVMFSSASAFLYCFKLIYGIYLGQSTHSIKEHKSLPIAFYISQFIGAMVLIILGIFPSLGLVVSNPILISLGFEPTLYNSLFELNSGFASFNGGVLMLVFVGIFSLILLIVSSLKNRIRERRDRYDISYCGEVPHPNSNLHFGYGVGEELRRVSFIKIILENSVAPYWERVAQVTKDSSFILKKLYNISVQNVGLITVIFFTILLFIGVQ
jgi:NADH-quinone oxidoreductase subunit M